MSNHSMRRLCLTLFLVSGSSIIGLQKASVEDQAPVLRPTRIGVRHIENSGVGYKTGYTTLDMFFAPNPAKRIITSFLDLRGHVLDNGKVAVNAGFGIRALAHCRVYGAHAYYDYRNTKVQHYNQVGVGFETMGVRWDFRLNGYLPVGKKKSHPYDTTRVSHLTVDSFQGNDLFIEHTTAIKSKIQFAMKGLDAEAAFHILKNKNIDFYVAAGPYYYNYKGRQAIGGRVRLSALIFRYLSLDFINSYDSRFHENAQGSIGINIPLGPRLKPSHNKRLTKCNDAQLLTQRLIQDVDRQEIIVVDRYRKSVSSDAVSIVINPFINSPWTLSLLRL